MADMSVLGRRSGWDQQGCAGAEHNVFQVSGADCLWLRLQPARHRRLLVERIAVNQMPYL